MNLMKRDILTLGHYDHSDQPASMRFLSIKLDSSPKTENVLTFRQLKSFRKILTVVFGES